MSSANTTTRESSEKLTTTGAAATTDAFRLSPFDGATVTMVVVGVGTPTFKLQGTNETIVSPVNWIDLITGKSKTQSFEIEGEKTRYWQYRLSQTGGDAGDATTYHVLRWRLR